MGKDKNSKSFEIALSGISCAIAVAVLPLGIMTGIGSLTAAGYFVAVLALMLPLSKQLLKGAFLSYAATCILTIVLGAAVKFWDLVPFIMFFGLHPIANVLQLKFKINKWVAFIIKALWFDTTLIAGYYLVFGGLLGGNLLPAEIYEIINKYIFLLIFTVGTALFFVYDYLIFKMQIMVNSLVYKIKK